jgi:hypothetical protein
MRKDGNKSHHSRTNEHGFVERKSRSDKRDWLQTAVAFANSAPIGWPAIPLLGVEDDGNLRDDKILTRSWHEPRAGLTCLQDRLAGKHCRTAPSALSATNGVYVADACLDDSRFSLPRLSWCPGSIRTLFNSF